MIADANGEAGSPTRVMAAGARLGWLRERAWMALRLAVLRSRTNPIAEQRELTAKPVSAASWRPSASYVGTNNHLYHNWQTARAAGWLNQNGVGGAVTDPAAGLGSNPNDMLAGGNCNALIDVAVTVSVTEDLVYKTDGPPNPGSGSVSGFTWQMNCYAPKGDESLVQQYVMGFDGSQIYGQMNNWENTETALINKAWTLAKVPEKIPAGYEMVMSLTNEDQSNINRVSFAVINEKGDLAGSHATNLVSR